MISDDAGRSHSVLHNRLPDASEGGPAVGGSTAAAADHDYRGTAAWRRGVALAVASVPESVTLGSLDLARVEPCPKCGTPTRFMGNVPIGGSGLDLIRVDRAYCASCIHAGTVAAVVAAGLR